MESVLKERNVVQPDEEFRNVFGGNQETYKIGVKSKQLRKEKKKKKKKKT